MNDTFHIHVNALPPRIAQANHAKERMLFAELWVEVGDKAFPEKGWIDTADVVLSWWLHQITKLTVGASSAQLQFMEGPFSGRLVREDRGDDLLVAEFIGGENRLTARIALLDLQTEAETAGLKFAKQIGHQHSGSACIPEIERAVQQLRKSRKPRE